MNELLHRDICLPAVPRQPSDVDSWLVDCKEAIVTVKQLKKALVDFIEQQAKCETNSYFPHLHQPREKWWRDVDRAIERIKADDGLCPPVCLAKAAIVDSVRAAAADGADLVMDDLVGRVDRALTMAHDCGMRLWYRQHPILSQHVFHDPRIVTELLRVLMEPIHLSHDTHDMTHLHNQLSASVVEELMNGRMHVSAIDVLWKDFGDRHGLKGDALRQTVINMLEQLNLLTRDRETVDVYMSMLLMCRYDFAGRPRQSFVYSEKRMTVARSPTESPWYAIDIVFEAGSQIAGPGGVKMAAGIPPEDLAEKFLLRLYDQQTVWWRSVAVGSGSQSYMTRLQLYRNCLTDGELCEVTSARTGRGDEVFRALLWDPTHSRAPHTAKRILDIFQELVRAQYPSVFYKARVVLAPCVTYAVPTVDGITAPLLQNESDSWHFWLSSIRLDDDGYANPNQTSRPDAQSLSRNQATEIDGMIRPASGMGSTHAIHVRRVWPIAANDLSAMLVNGGLLAAREAYALSAVVSDNPQSVVSRISSHQGVKLDPGDVEWAADRIVEYLKSIQVMPKTQPVVAHSVLGDNVHYSCFIGYRVTPDEPVAESLYDKLRARGYTVFLSKFCLPPAELWGPNFRLGLARSRVFLPLMSSAGLAPLRDEARNHSSDNVLLEYHIALGLLNGFGGSSGIDGDSFHIHPVLVGARDRNTLVEFDAFGGYSSTLAPSLCVMSDNESGNDDAHKKSDEEDEIELGMSEDKPPTYICRNCITFTYFPIIIIIILQEMRIVRKRTRKMPRERRRRATRTLKIQHLRIICMPANL
jgi:hypothetical protein